MAEDGVGPLGHAVYAAWVAHVTSLLDQNSSLQVMGIFRQLDADGDGLLSRREFELGVQRAGMPLQDGELEALLNYVDEDGSDMITFREFARGVVRSPVPPPPPTAAIEPRIGDEELRRILQPPAPVAAEPPTVFVEGLDKADGLAQADALEPLDGSAVLGTGASASFQETFEALLRGKGYDIGLSDASESEDEDGQFSALPSLSGSISSARGEDAVLGTSSPSGPTQRRLDHPGLSPIRRKEAVVRDTGKPTSTSVADLSLLDLGVEARDERLGELLRVVRLLQERVESSDAEVQQLREEAAAEKQRQVDREATLRQRATGLRAALNDERAKNLRLQRQRLEDADSHELAASQLKLDRERDGSEAEGLRAQAAAAQARAKLLEGQLEEERGARAAEAQRGRAAAAELEATKEQLRDALAQYRETVAELAAQREERARLEQGNAGLRVTVSEAKANEAELARSHQDLMLAFDANATRNAQRGSENQTLREELDARRTEVAQLHTKLAALDTAVQQRTATLEAQLRRATDAGADAERQLGALREQTDGSLEALRQERAALLNELAAKGEQLTTAQARADGLESRLWEQAVETERQKTTDDLAIQRLQMERDQALQDLGAATQRVRGLEGRALQLQADAERRDRAAAEAEAQSTALGGELRASRRQLAESRAGVARLEAEVGSLQGQLETRAQLQVVLQADKAELKERVRELQAQRSRLEADAEANESLNQSMRELPPSDTEALTANVDDDRLRDLLRRHAERLNRLNSVLHTYDGQAQRVQADLSGLLLGVQAQDVDPLSHSSGGYYSPTVASPAGSVHGDADADDAAALLVDEPERDGP